MLDEQARVEQALRIHCPKRVAAEDLCFAGRVGELSRRMKRLVRSFGQAVFKRTLQERSDELGFELEWVDPAHTSRTRSYCRLVFKGNRINESFKRKPPAGIRPTRTSTPPRTSPDVPATPWHPRRGRPGPRARGPGGRGRWSFGWASERSGLDVRPSPVPSGCCGAAGSETMGLLALAEAEMLGPARRGTVLQAARAATSTDLFRRLSF